MSIYAGKPEVNYTDGIRRQQTALFAAIWRFVGDNFA